MNTNTVLPYVSEASIEDTYTDQCIEVSFNKEKNTLSLETGIGEGIFLSKAALRKIYNIFCSGRV